VRPEPDFEKSAVQMRSRIRAKFVKKEATVEQRVIQNAWEKKV
jgi:hypothetical protein